jgi:hypothetical protein
MDRSIVLSLCIKPWVRLKENSVTLVVFVMVFPPQEAVVYEEECALLLMGMQNGLMAIMTKGDCVQWGSRIAPRDVVQFKPAIGASALKTSENIQIAKPY